MFQVCGSSVPTAPAKPRSSPQAARLGRLVPRQRSELCQNELCMTRINVFEHDSAKSGAPGS